MSSRDELTKNILDYDIVVLTETRCSGPNKVSFSNYNTVNSKNRLGSGGVSISVRRHLEFEILPIVGTLPVGYDVICVRTKNFNRNINIVAVYRHPREAMFRRDLQPVFHALKDNDNDSIILGDVNAHNMAWNCPNTSKNGDLLYEGIIDRVSYRQLEEAWDSDHVPISFTFDAYPEIYRKITNRLSTKRTDWSRFGSLVEKEIEASLISQVDLFKADLEKL
ncbi:uncharacterized protein LOC112455797 [Temnothorax curvispinosus]|uniref:Uncharacterized protein LOC112455797 n=1 Tax=Temnothorax curvispinosus TaxID=300111 RepID=A0A6J1PWN1_9HYME|nr:uncharacterized protein LOC112455797 [Temnothorax curvispinosus]